MISCLYSYIQEKQSPVNELLKKADHLIATQNTQPEVYAAMADSLGLAWKDVNDILQKRSYLLHLNVEYHRYGSTFTENTRYKSHINSITLYLSIM